MKLTLASATLTSGVLLQAATALSPQSLRGGALEEESQQRRDLQGNSANAPGQLKKLFQPCTLFEKVRDFEDGSEETSWDCFADPSEGFDIVAVEGLDFSGITSGDFTLSYPGGLLIAQGKARVPDKSKAVFNRGRRRDLKEEQQRKLQAQQRSLTVVKVDVTCSESGSSYATQSASTFSKEVFGDGAGDAVNIVSQMDACSNGALTFDKWNPNSVTPADTSASVAVTNGILSVSVEVDCTATLAADDPDGIIRNAATDELAQYFGSGFENLGWLPQNDPFANHFMYCLPDAFMSGIAYAWFNGFISVYKNAWCTYPSAQMHEIGHNLNVHHASEGSSEYGDQTGFMGFSYSVDEQRMCFNPANMYQLGWLNSGNIVDYGSFSEIPGTQSITLTGHTIYGTALPQAIRVPGAPDDYYVWFNRASGNNVNTREAANQVVIVKRTAGTGRSKSFLVSKLSAGGFVSTGDPGYEFDVTVSSIDTISNTAVVALTTGNISPTEAPVAPTNPPVAPTPPPTNAPVAPTPPPTSAPVAPTPPPTDAPVAPTNPPVAPTNAPVAPTNPPVAPTNAPVAPTNPPVAPTNAPVAPTNPPVAPQCSDITGGGGCKKSPLGCRWSKGRCFPR